VIISQRSSVLNQLLAIEDRPQDYFSSPSELILPGIRHDIMKIMLCFIYTDSVPNLDRLSFASLMDVWSAAKSMDLCKLAHKCREILEKDHGYQVNIDEQPKASSSSGNNHRDPAALNPPLPSFASDMSKALGDSRFADVRIHVQDKTLYAHECMLRHASGYFASLLDGSKQNERTLGSTTTATTTTLELPGTYAQVVRLLLYLYTGYSTSATSASQQDLIDDLINAHRYQLPEMKSQCDSAIQVTPENACDMLLLSIQVNSTRLKIQSMHIMSKYLSKQVEHQVLKAKFDSTLAACPMSIKDELFEMIKDAKGVGSIIPQSRKDLAAAMLERSHQQKARMQEKMMIDLTGSDADGLSMRNIFILSVMVIGHIYLQRFVSFAAFVPVVNGLALVMVFIHLFQRLK